MPSHLPPPNAPLPPQGPPRRMLNTKEAADYLGIGVDKLKASRLTNPRCEGPAFSRFGRRVVYDIEVLKQWILDHTVVPGV